MKSSLIALSISAVSFTILSCNNSGTNEESKTDTTNTSGSKTDMVARGAYLVNLGGCNDCHSPKKFTAEGPAVDSSKLLSGHPANEPMPAFDTAALKPGTGFKWDLI